MLCSLLTQRTLKRLKSRLHSLSSCQHWDSAKPLLQLPECWSSDFQWGWRGTVGPHLAGTVIQNLQVGKKENRSKRSREGNVWINTYLYLITYKNSQEKATPQKEGFLPCSGHYIHSHWKWCTRELMAGIFTWDEGPLCLSAGSRFFLKSVLYSIVPSRLCLCV